MLHQSERPFYIDTSSSRVYNEIHIARRINKTAGSRRCLRLLCVISRVNAAGNAVSQLRRQNPDAEFRTSVRKSGARTRLHWTQRTGRLRKTYGVNKFCLICRHKSVRQSFEARWSMRAVTSACLAYARVHARARARIYTVAHLPALLLTHSVRFRRSRVIKLSTQL